MNRLNVGCRLARSYSTFSSTSVLHKALPLVPAHGWSGALLASIRAYGLSDQATSGFSAEDLVRYHYEVQLKKLSEHKPTETDLFPRLRELLVFRLVNGNKHIAPAQLADAISIVLKSHPASTSFDALGKISDEIWFKAGDRSTDTAWYARRGALVAIYSACEAFQSRDTSHGFRDTVSLANRLVSGLENTEYAKNSVGQWLDFNVRGAFNVLQTWR